MTKPRLFLPEWSPTKAILLAWPYPGSDWQNNLTAAQSCYCAMLRAFSAVVDVWLLVHPSVDREAFYRFLDEHGVDLGRIHVEHTIVYDDTWTRDYGPLSTTQGYIQFGFNGWGGKYSAPNDNRVPNNIEHLLNSSVFDCGFICEGGGLETNGSTLLVNRDCIVDPLRNSELSQDEIADRLGHHLGVTSIEWLSHIQLTGDDTDGHIDTIARFVATNHVVYAGRNPSHLDAASLQSLHDQLQSIAQRQGWQLTELPSPSVYSQLDGRLLPATYANFLLCNQTLFLPIYGLDMDAAAIEILAKACPDYTLVPIRCEALLEQHGSLHCATMQIIDLAKI